MSLNDFFHQLDAAVIAQLIATGREEDLFLEFKTVTAPSLTRDDRRNVARVLSGFANSSGGIVIWGVEARRNNDGIDGASRLCPLDPVALLLSRLNQFTGEFVSPIVPGVQHRAIITDGSAGVVASLVPESAAGPHMAKAGEDRYFKRSGDGFYKMEHFDIADMFGRRSAPDISLTATVVCDATMDGGTGGRRRYKGRVVFGLKNTGRGAATAPYVSLTIGEQYSRDTYGVTGNGEEGLPRVWRSGSPSELSYGGDTTRVIHSGTGIDVCAVVLEFGADGACPRDLVVDFVVAAEGWAARQGRATIQGFYMQEGLVRGDRRSRSFTTTVPTV